MYQAIALLPYIPVRLDASERSEMVTQVLFGETVSVFGTRGSWSNIRINHDAYEGWCDTKMLTRLTDELHDDHLLYVNDIEARVTSDDGALRLSGGSVIRNYDACSKQFSIGNRFFSLEDDQVVKPCENMMEIIDRLVGLKGVPYLWGGRSVWGLDCSGLSQLFGRMLGLALPRDARDQVEIGEEVMFVQDVKIGDLAFFGELESITHVGIVVGPKEILHASGQVRVDGLDHQGIFKPSTGEYTHKLRAIKRLKA